MEIRKYKTVMRLYLEQHGNSDFPCLRKRNVDGSRERKG